MTVIRNEAERLIDVDLDLVESHKFIRTLIKIKYIRLGYLPDYPPHLISDEEMCDAFISKGSNTPLFFYDFYPQIDGIDQACINTNRLPNEIPKYLSDVYNDLVEALLWHIDKFKTTPEDERDMPYWVYSYMLGVSLSSMSEQADIHDFLVIIDNDNINDNYDVSTAMICYELSRESLLKQSPDSRLNHPPSIFAEPHLIKYATIRNIANKHDEEEIYNAVSTN